MPFGDYDDWRQRHDVPSDVPAAGAANYVQQQVEAGTDPVVSDPAVWSMVVHDAVKVSGLDEAAHSDPAAFLQVADQLGLPDELVREALFGRDL